MHVGSQPYIVGEVPSLVVGVFVDGDIVAVPIPVVAISEVKRGDAEIVAIEPEPAGIATLDAPAVTAPETALEVAVFPRMVDVKARVVATVVVSHPFPVVMHVGSLGMIATIAKVPVVGVVMIDLTMITVVALAFVPVAMVGLRPVARDVSAADIVVAVVPVMVVIMLRLYEDRHGQDQRRC